MRDAAGITKTPNMSVAQVKDAQSAMPARRWRDRIENEGPLGFLMVSPAVLFLLFMLGYPFVLAIYLSLTDKRIGADPNFVGLNNFILLAETPRFWRAVQNSLVYTGLALILKFFGGLGLALLLNRQFVGQRLSRAIFLLPWIAPTVFSTLAWWWMFDPSFGVVNVLLKRMGIVQSNIPFLVDPNLAMALLIFVNAWRGIPFFAIVFLAAMQTVSQELLDASKIDGASGWQMLWKVILPLIMPVVLIVMLISTIGTISDFELPFLLTRGGPADATLVFGILTYNYSLESGLYGLGTSVTVTMFPLLALLVIWTLTEIRRDDKVR